MYEYTNVMVYTREWYRDSMKAVKGKIAPWYPRPEEGLVSQEGLGEMDEFLNRYATEGWELVTAVASSSSSNAAGAPINDFTLFTFRRQLR